MFKGKHMAGCVLSAGCVLGAALALPAAVHAGDFSGLPTVTPWGDTYAGAVATATLRGNGTYFIIDRNAGQRREEETRTQRGPLILTVADTRCASVGEVCIIRGTR